MKGNKPVFWPNIPFSGSHTLNFRGKKPEEDD